MASNKIPGDILGIEVNGSFISCEISCEFTFETDMRPASPEDAGRWREYIAGVRSWGVNLNAATLFNTAGAGLGTILNAFLTGELMDIRFTIKDAVLPQFLIFGKAFVQSGGISAERKTRSSWNTTLVGSGKFEIDMHNEINLLSTNGGGIDVLTDGDGNIILV